MAADNNEAELWVGWTRDAMKSFDVGELDPEDDEAIDALVDDMADIATQYADAMMDEYTERFGSSGGRKKRRKKGRRRSDDGDGE